MAEIDIIYEVCDELTSPADAPTHTPTHQQNGDTDNSQYPSLPSTSSLFDSSSISKDDKTTKQVNNSSSFTSYQEGQKQVI